MHTIVCVRARVQAQAWPGLAQVLDSCQHMSQGLATILIIVGLWFLACGQKWHRICIAFNCLILGAWAGGMLGKQGNAVLPGMIIGGFLGMLAAWPLLKFTVQLISAGVGFVVGSCVWRTYPNLMPQYAWAGGAIGLIFLYMLSHISLRWTIILATGFQGAARFIAGVLGWLYQIDSIKGSVDGALTSNHYLMPLAVAIPAIVGLIFQHTSATAPASVAKKPAI